MGAGNGTAGGEESAGDLLSVIAEEVLAAESVEPGTTFVEAVGWMHRVGAGSAGHFAVA